MSPWQEYLWRLQNPEAAERERWEDSPVVIQDECPATDGMTLEQLMAAALARTACRGPNMKCRAVPQVTPEESRCAGVVLPRNADAFAVKQRCRRPARPNGYCWAHAYHAAGAAGEGS